MTSVLDSISAKQQLVIEPFESERCSDYLNPMTDISDDTLPKKLKPDNVIGTLS